MKFDGYCFIIFNTYFYKGVHVHWSVFTATSSTEPVIRFWDFQFLLDLEVEIPTSDFLFIKDFKKICSSAKTEISPANQAIKTPLRLYWVGWWYAG